MTEDLRPDAEQIEHHRTLLALWSRDTPSLEGAEWAYGSAKQLEPLHIAYIYSTVTDQGIHLAHIYEDYDEVDVLLFDPLPIPPAEFAAPADSLASV